MEQEALKERHRLVQCWLSNIFGEHGIPQYEVNNSTITYLYHLMLHNEEMDKLAQLATLDISQKTEEYKLEASRIRECLEGVGLPVYVLSSAGKTSLKTLTDLAGKLQIKDANKSSYCLAMADLSNELANVSDQIVEKQTEIDNLQKQAEITEKYLYNIDSFYGKSEEHSLVDIPVLEKRKKDMETLRGKSKTYQSQIDDFENDGAAEIVDKKYLHHDNLLRLSQELVELKKELKPLQNKYKSYRSLPPDVNLAKVKIEEAKRQLAKLEKQLLTDVDLLAL